MLDILKLLAPNNPSHMQRQLAKNKINWLTSWSLYGGGKEKYISSYLLISFGILKEDAGCNGQGEESGSSRAAVVRNTWSKGIPFLKAYHTFIAFKIIVYICIYERQFYWA